MKNLRWLCGVILLAGTAVSGTALAEHGRGHAEFGFYFGPSFPGYYYPPPYYPYPYYPPTVVVPAQPPVYIEQGNPQPAPQQAPSSPANNYWYHCDSPDGYYPYIKDCPGGWQRVAPTPPSQQ